MISADAQSNFGWDLNDFTRASTLTSS